jgi:hypothetical protein
MIPWERLTFERNEPESLLIGSLTVALFGAVIIYIKRAYPNLRWKPTASLAGIVALIAGLLMAIKSFYELLVKLSN